MWLKAPKGVGAVSWGGECYPVKSGLVEVPDEAVELLAHGLTPTETPADNGGGPEQEMPKAQGSKPKAKR